MKAQVRREVDLCFYNLIPIVLQNHRFDIDEYEETEEKKQGGLSAKEYKKKWSRKRKNLTNNWRIW